MKRFDSWITLPLAGVAMSFALQAYAQVAQTAQGKPELVFQTGFGGTSDILPAPKSPANGVAGTYDIEQFVGKDDTLSEKSDWRKDLDENPAGGRFFIEYTGGDVSKRFARIIAEPGKSQNKVLHFWLADAWHASENQEKARIQTSLYGIQQPYKEFFHSERVFLHPDFKALESFPEKITWLTLGEYWNNEWWNPTEKYGFRVTFGIAKPSADKPDLRFLLEAENAGQKEVWRTYNADVVVPFGKWFTMETYFKEGNKDTGRFYVAITPDGGARQVLFDIHNYTHNTHDPAPNGMSGFNPMKLYTSKEVVQHVKSQGKVLQIYWDDFKLWKNKRPD